VPAILKNFISKEAQNSTTEAGITKLYLAARLCFRDVIQSDSKRSRQAATDFVSFTISAKCTFSKQLTTSLFSLLLFSEFGACLVQNNAPQEQP